MQATVYIIKDADAYRLGLEPVVRLWEPESVSRTWIRRVTVELPEGFFVRETVCGDFGVYRGEERYELETNQREEPVIINHKANGSYIPLRVLSEGWE